MVHKAVKNFLNRLIDLEADTVDWSEVENKPSTFAPAAHTHTLSDTTGLEAALAGKEPTLAAGTTAQYYRGDKTWQTLGKASVGLGNVDNTSDANKPISTAAATALAGKADLVGGKVPSSQLDRLSIGETLTAATQSAMLALDAQPGDVAIRTDNDTLWMLKKAPASTLGNWWDLTAALSGVAGVTSINSMTGTVTLGKSDIGLGNVDNTSDATKNSASATLTNKTISGSSNTLSNIAQSSVTNLSTDLGNKVTSYVNGTITAGFKQEVMTQAQFNALGTKDSKTVYLVTA